MAEQPCLDRCHTEHVVAAVDFNLVMNSTGEIIEVPCSGEETKFSEAELAELLALWGRRGS